MKRTSLMAAAVVLAVLLPVTTHAATRAYFVEPKMATSAWSPYGGYVGQSFIANVDSIYYLEWFVAEPSRPGHYRFEVLDAATSELVARGDAPVPDRGWQWLRCDSFTLGSLMFTKGREYILRVRQLENGDSVNFVYRTDNPYQYGVISVGGGQPQPPPQTSHDLVARVYGRMNPVSDVWRACVNHGNWPPPGNGGNEALEKAESIGIKWLRDDFGKWEGWEDDTQPSMGIYHRYEDRFSMTGILCYGSNDSAISSWSGADSPPNMHPPRNLFLGLTDTNNYWAGYCRSIMGSMPKVKYWEVWPEANANWLWQDPDIAYYQGSGGANDTVNTPRERCSLYVRMCQVAESVAQTLGGDPRRRILGGTPWRMLEWAVDDSTGDTTVAPGESWLRHMFDLAEHRYGGVENCFDIVSVHPYMFYDLEANDILHFIEDTFRINLDTARAVMRAAGYPGMELWATEYGWPRWDGRDKSPLTDTLMQADNLCKFYTSAVARQTDPCGGYDRAIWYELTAFRPDTQYIRKTEGFGLLDSGTGQPRLPHSWAMQQVGDVLGGKRLNGRVLTGDSVTDSLVRMYEFENPATSKKTWVCWKSGDGGQDVAVQLPARADSAYIEMLAYKEGTPPNGMRQANSYGWLGIGAADRPQFVTEPDNRPISRPDLVVDSFRVMPERPQVGKQMGFTAYVRNTDTARATPDTVWYEFLCDTALVSSFFGPRIDPGATDTIIMIGAVVPSWMRGERLFRLQANPGQKFVEKDGLDDNDGYSRNKVAYSPVGDIRGVVCGSHSNSPLPLLGFETHSLEADTLGSVPCESARLVQLWYANDTVVHGGDTTAWFCVNEEVALDTSWLYLSGQGRYKLFLQVKDSWSMSDLIPDTTHPYVVFDTTPPTGSIVISGGARFAPSSTCTLLLAAHDSASGVAQMRFMNRPQANLVRNSAFAEADGSWSFTAGGGGYDTSLQMAVLSAGPSQARVRQFVPAESISAYAGDSCVLEANVLVHVHDGDATGEVSFWFWSTREDTSQHDTLWELVDSASYSGSLLSLTGRYSLSTRFLLETPTPESGWVWRGGMVRVQAHGVDGGVGDVWTDNVAMNVFQPQAGYAWWGAYDTLAEWDIGSGAGQHVVRALFLDSAGTENATPFADTIILDPTAPVVDIGVPDPGQLVSGMVEVTGWAYDPVEVAGDTWFESRRLSYRHVDSTNWLPAGPDSVSYEPAYPDSQSVLGPAVHLGYWNTFSVPDGAYYVLLTGADSAGHVSSCTTWVIVSNEGGGGGMGEGPEGGGTGMGEGSVYVGSATGTVLHLSDDLDSLDCFQVTDSGSQAYVTAILEVGNDSLLVLDAYGKRIHKLHKGGQNRRRLVSNLSQPAGLTRDENGNFWLVDKGIHRIGKFRSNGTLVFIRGGLGADSLHFHSPEGIVVKGGLVYVADTKNDRIAVWDTSGNYKATIVGDFESPNAVLVTDSGTIYLTDGNDGRLKGITPLGGNIVTLGSSDSSKLRGLVLSENRHYLFSIAAQPNKVYKLRIQSDDSTPGGQQSAGKLNLPKTLSLAQPFPNPARTRLNIAYALPRQTRVVLKLYDIAGKLVTTLANGDQKPGYYNLTWNRQDAKGRSCACGVYFCTLAAENQRFSRKVILTE